MFSLKYELQSEFHLAGGVDVSGMQEIAGSSILGGEGFDSNGVIVLNEDSAAILEAVIREL